MAVLFKMAFFPRNTIKINPVYKYFSQAANYYRYKKMYRFGYPYSTFLVIYINCYHSCKCNSCFLFGNRKRHSHRFNDTWISLTSFPKCSYRKDKCSALTSLPTPVVESEKSLIESKHLHWCYLHITDRSNNNIIWIPDLVFLLMR